MTDRQTKRERKEEARRARLEAQRRAARKRQIRRIVSALVALAVVALIVVLVNASGKDEREQVAAINRLATTAKCEEVQSPANEGHDHISPPAQATYKGDPPTSGAHYNGFPQGPVPTGVAVNEVEPEGYVHNLEHGHVAIMFKPDVSEEIRNSLEDLARNDAQWVLAFPNSKMGPKIAVAAWDRLMTCDGTGTPTAISAAAKEFIGTFKDQARESAPGQPRSA